MMLPFISMLSAPSSAASLPYLDVVAKAIGIDVASVEIPHLGIAVALLLLVALLARLASAWAIEILALRFGAALFAKVVSRLIRAPYSWLKAQNASALSQRVMTDATTVGLTIYPGALELLYGVTILITGFVVILASASLHATLILCAIGAIGASILLLMNPATLRQTSIFRHSLVETTRVSAEMFANQKSIKASASEEFFVRRLVSAFRISSLARLKLNLFNKAVPSLVLCLGQVGLIAVALAMFASGTPSTELLPQLALITILAARILPVMAGLTGSSTKLTKSIPYYEGLRRTLEQVDQLMSASDETQRPAVAIWQTLAFERVFFRHAATNNNQLTDLTLTIRCGGRFGIIGPSGAGKSTLVDLLLRLIEPTAGRITLDGKPLSDYSRANWTSRIGYVAQEVPVIDDTVRRNVAFGVPDGRIDDSKIWQALEHAGVAEDVRRLSAGLDSPVGDMGGRMSGGQRQRLAIARALYHEPDILLLDEATSGLDPATEAAVLQNLLTVKEGLTLIMVTHRLPTTAICDEVFVLAEGRLAATGTYAQLLENPAIAALLSGAGGGDAAAKAHALP